MNKKNLILLIFIFMILFGCSCSCRNNKKIEKLRGVDAKDELKCLQFTGEKKNVCLDDAIKKYEKIKTPIAKFNIGQIYRQEKKDIKKAIEIFESISNDIPEANMILARLYFKEYFRLWNDNNDNNDDEAEIFKAKILPAYQRAVKMGYNLAHYELGKIYLEGKWWEKDIKKAEDHFKKALEGDDLKENIKEDIKKSFELIEQKKEMTTKEYNEDIAGDEMSWMWSGAHKCQELIGVNARCMASIKAQLANPIK